EQTLDRYPESRLTDTKPSSLSERSGVMLSENTLIINRPVEDVFQFLITPEHNELWMSMIINTIRDETGPVSLGSTWQHQAKFMGRQIDLNFEVTELEPNRRVCVRNVAGPISFHGCYRLKAANGGTQFTHTLEGDPGSFFR